MKIVQTQVTSVQIYRIGAEIVRSGSVALPEGTSQIMIAGLNRESETDTVKMFFPAGIEMSDIRFTDLGNEKDRPSDAIQEQIDTLKSEIDIKKLQGQLWKENGDFSGRGTQSVGEIEAYITALPERLGTLTSDIRRLQKEVDEKEKELARQRDKEQLPFIVVELTAAQAGTYPFEVRLFETSASWEPVFEIHTDAKAPLSLRARARIHQTSPEDWTDITVSLLTGRPSGGRVPTLRSTYLNIKKETPPRPSPMMASKSIAPLGRGAMMQESVLAAPAMGTTMQLDRAETKSAEVSSEETMTEYILPDKKTIPTDRHGDNKGTMVDLQRYEIPARYETILVPRLDLKGYLTAVLDPKDLPDTVKGTAAIYLKGIYTGDAEIAPDLSKESIRISLGTEEALHGTRVEKTKKESQSILKGVKYTDYEYELKIRNGKDTPVEVVVQDSIPVSQDKTIAVETQRTDQAELEEETGFLRWKLELEPKQIRTIGFQYRVSWPKDSELRMSVGPAPAGSSGTRWCHVCGSRVYGAFCPECGAKVD